jgi:murein endopeptidase
MNLRAVLFVAPMVVAPVEPEPATRHLDFLAGLTVPLPVVADEEPALQQIVVPPEEEAPVPAVDALVEYPRTEFDLDVVTWTVDRTAEARDIAEAWGMRTKHLRLLNPGLPRHRPIQAGTELVVFRKIPRKPSCSVGAPNKGWLRTGTALPEGANWRLRPRRGATFGSKHTIEGMLMALEAYGTAYPDGPRIRIGDLSRRSGRQLHPHASHRTGRDVDIGYILDPAKRGDRFWQSADEKNLDVEKTWFFIKALVETGRVQSIFVSGKLQRLLMAQARKELSREDMARYFRRANPDPNTHSIIRHWRGHRDHMHVRFNCADFERLCVSRSIDP